MSGSLHDYCTSSNRVCPQPNRWQELWELLLAAGAREAGSGTMVPFVLAAWWEAGDHQKQRRFLDHLALADVLGISEQVEQLLRGLTEGEWHHWRR